LISVSGGAACNHSRASQIHCQPVTIDTFVLPSGLGTNSPGHKQKPRALARGVEE
jgi:hypothetical protein